MVRHREHWSDGSDGSDRFGQYPDGSDRSDSVPLLVVVTVSLVITREGEALIYEWAASSSLRAGLGLRIATTAPSSERDLLRLAPAVVP